jgi:hypothetical protein
MPGDDHLGCPIGLESAHRSQSALELAMISFDRIVLILLDVVPRRRQAHTAKIAYPDLPLCGHACQPGPSPRWGARRQRREPAANA